MAKKPNIVADAIQAYKPRQFPSLIAAADEDVKEYCDSIREKYRKRELCSIPIKHFHDFAKQTFGDRAAFGLSAFRAYIRG